MKFCFTQIWILTVLLLITASSQAQSHGKSKNVTSYKKKLVVPPPTKWMSSSQKKKDPPKVKLEPKKVRVTYIYDTLPSGVKSKVVGYIDEKNVFIMDSVATYAKEEPHKIPLKKTAPKPPPPPSETKFSNSEGIHITHSPIPDQKTCNYFIDYINSYNRNYGAGLRKLKYSKRSTLAYIEGTLKRTGLPVQMKYLAVIESRLNTHARSPVGAVGVWQFMSPTARDMNLIVNEKMDQRMDLHKSTYAATKYMKHLYRIFGDWLLVVASYNSGPGPVLKAIRTSGSKNFWNIRYRLPRETRGHVLAFLATAAIMERLDKFSGLYDLNPARLQLENSVDEIEPKAKFDRKFNEGELSNLIVLTVDQPLHSRVLCRRLELTTKDFNRWNPKFDEELAKEKSSYRLYIPRQKMEGYMDMKNMIYKESMDHRKQIASKAASKTIDQLVEKSQRDDATKNHIVQYGETIDSIADTYNTTVSQIQKLNKLSNAEVYPGDILRVE